MPDVHAKLSASGSHIWLNCPPSIKLSEGVPDRTTAYAEEGTTAHSLAELKLNMKLEELSPRAYAPKLIKIHDSDYYNEEMERTISDYVDWVMEYYNGIKAEDKELLTEQRLDFSEWVPGGFGTGDVVIPADNTLTVIDLKYGKGVPVSAVENPQLMLYGLGAYYGFSLAGDIDTVRMIINQPRLDSISEYEISVEDLLKWADEYVKPRAQMAMNGEGELTPGEHCRFCKVKAICKARADLIMEEAKHDFDDPGLLTDDELSHILGVLDQIQAWITDVKDYTLDAAKNGHKYPGWKLVEGRANRKYADAAKVEEKLLEKGFDKCVIYKDPELLGLTAMEKVVGGKKKLEGILGDLIIKPQGAPTLVPESDKRPELNSAETDFDIKGEE